MDEDIVEDMDGEINDQFQGMSIVTELLHPLKIDNQCQTPQEAWTQMGIPITDTHLQYHESILDFGTIFQRRTNENVYLVPAFQDTRKLIKVSVIW